MAKLVKLLVVDDSITFRKIVEEALAGETDIKIIGSVRNGDKALEFIQNLRPDLVTLDLEMPGLDGIQTLQAIQTYNATTPNLPPIGVIMLSAHTQRGADVTLKALEGGAFDFICKPSKPDYEENRISLNRQLTTKISIWLSSRKTSSPVPTFSPPTASGIPRPQFSNSAGSPYEVVGIGVSTGGPKALAELLPKLCHKIELPILIVQHMPPVFTKSLADQLNSKCSPYRIVEAADGDLVEPKTAYIAPGGKHMFLRKSGSKVKIELNEQPPENGCRPAVDVLFRSLADIYGGKTIAVVLTGMGNDGTKGLAPLKRAGARVLVQDEASSVVWGMPKSALDSGHVDEVKSLGDLAEAIRINLLKKTGE